MRLKQDKYKTKTRQSKYLLNSMITKKAAKKLIKELPRGSARLISQRLKLQGCEYTPDYIRKVLDPDDPRSNRDIIAEANALRKEMKELSISMEDDILKS